VRHPDRPPEDDLAAERTRMVRRDLADRDIRDARVLDAMREIPRERFVPPFDRDRAYDDSPLPIGCGQTISQPYIVALMTQMLELTGTERVLEIGTGSGYQTVILANLAREVWSVERVASLSGEAAARLEALGLEKVRLRTDDGTQGWPEAAPFDRVIVTAACPEVPAPLTDQLAEGGILVAPVGPRRGQTLLRVEKRGGRLHRTAGCPCIFVPLVGMDGFPER